MVCQLPHGDERCGNTNVNNFLLSMYEESRMPFTVPCQALKTASPVMTGVQGTSVASEWELKNPHIP